MKTSKKILSLIFVLLLILPFTFLSVNAAGAKYEYVYDNGNFINDAEESQLNEQIKSKIAESGCKIYVVTYDIDLAIYNRDEAGNQFLKEQKINKNQDLVVLVVCRRFSEFIYDMYYYGKAPDNISNKEVNFILDSDNVYNNLKGGKIYEGSSAFVNLTAKGFSGRVGESYWKIAGISFAIALVIAIIICVGVVAKYKMKSRATNYPLEHYAKMNLTNSEDVFVGSFVTKRVINTNNGRSGGGRVGGGGGGGSHAGGR